MLKNRKPKSDWKTGDRCFYEENWSFVATGAKITKISTGSDGVAYADLKCLPPAYGSTCRPLDCLFETKEACITAQKKSSNDKIEAYEAEMPDVAAMIRFAYSHNVATCEEYTDWDARTAYARRAKDLLGIDLTD